MKTRKQKVICRVLCMVVSILLLASFFVVPVSAVDILTKFEIENIMYEHGGDHHDPDQRPYSSLHLISDSFELRNLGFLNETTSTSNTLVVPFEILNTDDSYLEFMFPDVEFTGNYGIYYINQLFDDGVTRTFLPGDTLFINGSFFGGWTLDDSVISRCRFTLRDNGNDYDFAYGRVVAFTDEIEIDLNEDSEGFNYSRLAFHFTNEISSSDLCLCFEFYVDAPSHESAIGFEFTKFLVEFGPGVSPNYPIYPSAPGKNEVDGFGSVEQDVIQSQESAITDGVNNIITGEFALDDLEADLQLVPFSAELIKIMNRLNLIPGIDPIIQISLSLGLLASFLSLAGSIISAADRKVGQAKREAQRESRSMSKK